MARCFVAIAFGKDDTDAVFDDLISPAVSTCCSSIARRVDRIEHNDDIDNRIIAELDEADFVIADLTYARPSVYFEAGYAQRRIPVIYTVRSDHFKDNSATDPLGNLRVHFDLKMKNIIDWRNPKDASFRRRLEKRIRHVLRPLAAKNKANAARAEAIASFGRLALDARVRKVQMAALDTLERLGFAGGRGKEGVRLADLTRAGKGVLEAVHVKTVDAVRKDDLRKLVRGYSRPWYDLNSGGFRPRRILQTVVVCSLGKVNHAVAAQVLRQHDFDESTMTFSRDTVTTVLGAKFFKPGTEIRYVYSYASASSELRITRGSSSTKLTFHDGCWGNYGKDSKGTHRFICRSPEAVVPTRQTFIFVDQVRETETLAERLSAVMPSAKTSGRTVLIA